MANTTLDFKKHCAIPFGSYCQVFWDKYPSNTPKEWTIAAICLGPTGNAQGGYKYYALATKKKIVQPQVIALPMTTEIIQWVEKIVASQNMPENIIFTTNRGEIVELDVNFVEDIDALNIDESNYFPTALSQECETTEPQSLYDGVGVLPAMPEDLAYNWSIPSDGNCHLILQEDGEIDTASDDSATSSRLVGWEEEHIAGEQGQQTANQDQFDYSSNDDDYVAKEPSSDSSSDTASNGISSIRSDSPGSYPTRSTRNANPIYKPTRGFHAALTSIMHSEACRMAGVSPENIPSMEANQGISSYFSYAMMMHNEPRFFPDGVFNDTMPLVAHKVMMHMALKRGLSNMAYVEKKPCPPN